ncbi:hypothetical protein FisN_24Hh062 [Fistulifera solaris]|uniref:Uncharacterized protein n=1 Tax=Fistulifera solaris TaxID=1519565 RepID=A0A1Z5JEQ0_FISSO|nr:hypothetical protein FisN_24Hh062 [Fistulifera solaris]|eukprot:GAX12487.1 hypothetical protein FisN_24Hh062 [Fistulifera solaris]
MAISETSVEEIVSPHRKSFWSRFRRPLKQNDKRPSVSHNNKLFPQHHPVVNEQAPPAREAAFSGPPRYDWMDIETAAALQIQAAFRRHRILQQLENAGHSTVAIRQRQQRRSRPNLLACCGVGFLFDYNDELERQEDYSKQQQERAEREAQLRDQYLRKQRQHEAETPVLEAFEVVE